MKIELQKNMKLYFRSLEASLMKLERFYNEVAKDSVFEKKFSQMPLELKQLQHQLLSITGDVNPEADLHIVSAESSLLSAEKELILLSKIRFWKGRDQNKPPVSGYLEPKFN